jgi:Fe-S-cluster containining protein
MKSLILKCTQIEEIEFNCKQCGSCCSGTGEVYITTKELQEIAAFLKISLREAKRKYVHTRNNKKILKDSEKAACIFLSNNKCRIYPVRPKQCRSFPFWLEIMKDKKKWLSYLKDCQALKFSKKTKLPNPLYIMITHKTNPMRKLKKSAKLYTN